MTLNKLLYSNNLKYKIEKYTKACLECAKCKSIKNFAFLNSEKHAQEAIHFIQFKLIEFVILKKIRK